MRWLTAALLLFTVTACSVPEMDVADIQEGVERAMADADVDGDVTVADAPIAGLWSADVTSPAGTLTVEVDGTSGKLESIFVGSGRDLSEPQLKVLAAHRYNPDSDAVGLRRGLIGVLVVLGAAVGVLAWARRSRLREEAAVEAAAGIDA